MGEVVVVFVVVVWVGGGEGVCDWGRKSVGRDEGG